MAYPTANPAAKPLINQTIRADGGRMADTNVMAWTLACPWCDWSLYVNHRGGPYGAGEEAAQRAQSHVEADHPGKTWAEFLKESSDA